MTQGYDDDAPRIAEIARSLSDFRHEFRTFTGEAVRKDVYSAHISSIQMQIDALAREDKRLELEVERDRSERDTDRRDVRKALLTASLSVLVAIVLLIVEIVIK